MGVPVRTLPKSSVTLVSQNTDMLLVPCSRTPGGSLLVPGEGPNSPPQNFLPGLFVVSSLCGRPALPVTPHATPTSSSAPGAPP